MNSDDKRQNEAHRQRTEQRPASGVGELCVAPLICASLLLQRSSAIAFAVHRFPRSASPAPMRVQASWREGREGGEASWPPVSKSARGQLAAAAAVCLRWRSVHPPCDGRHLLKSTIYQLTRRVNGLEMAQLHDERIEHSREVSKPDSRLQRVDSTRRAGGRRGGREGTVVSSRAAPVEEPDGTGYDQCCARVVSAPVSLAGLRGSVGNGPETQQRAVFPSLHSRPDGGDPPKRISFGSASASECASHAHRVRAMSRPSCAAWSAE